MRNFSIQWKITLLSAIGLLSAVVLLIGLSVYALQSTKGLVLEQTDKPINRTTADSSPMADNSVIFHWIEKLRIKFP